MRYKWDSKENKKTKSYNKVAIRRAMLKTGREKNEQNVLQTLPHGNLAPAG